MAEASEAKASLGLSNSVALSGNAVKLYYFAYGSNMNQEQISARCATPKVVAIAKLPNHRVAFFGHSAVWDGAEETVRPTPSHDVWGVVYDLSSSDREHLDDAQDARLDGSGPYFHSPAKVTGQDGTVYSVLLFKKDHLGISQKPSQEYLNFIVQGAVEHQLPSAYVETLRGQDSQKAGYAVPRKRSIRNLASGSGCSQCGDAAASPSSVININLGSGSHS